MKKAGQKSLSAKTQPEARCIQIANLLLRIGIGQWMIVQPARGEIDVHHLA
jgi:hypothetical protein